MSFPKFYVTYCVMDMDAGANPFGHCCLLFSKQEAKDEPIQVVDGIGYYSQPSTTTNPLIKSIKSLLCLNVDLQDGHGVLEQESMRELNGDGLKGISFPLSEEQFNLLQTAYRKRMHIEHNAIEEHNKELASKGKPANGHTRYLAEKEKGSSRLGIFHITMTYSLEKGFDSSSSYTCKTDALKFLQDHGVINQHLREQLTDTGGKHAFPCFSSVTLAPIRLVAVGPFQKCIAKENKVFYNPKWKHNELFWVTPIITLDDINDFKEIPYELRRTLNRMTKMKQTLHKALELHPRHAQQLTTQLGRIESLAYRFNNVHQNQNKKYLQAQLMFANKTLNMTPFAIDPERINASFLLRAYESVAAQNSLIGFGTIIIAVGLLFVTHPVAGITLGTLAAIETGHQLFRFYKEESEYATARKDYLEFNSGTPTSEEGQILPSKTRGRWIIDGPKPATSEFIAPPLPQLI